MKPASSHPSKLPGNRPASVVVSAVSSPRSAVLYRHGYVFATIRSRFERECIEYEPTGSPWFETLMDFRGSALPAPKRSSDRIWGWRCGVGLLSVAGLFPSDRYNGNKAVI